MIGRAVEKGLTSLVARWMLEGQCDAILDRVRSAGALDAAEVEALRAQTRARLERLRDEGEPYAAMLGEAAAAALTQAQASPMATALRASGKAMGPMLAHWLRAAATAAEGRRTGPAASETTAGETTSGEATAGETTAGAPAAGDSTAPGETTDAEAS